MFFALQCVSLQYSSNRLLVNQMINEYLTKLQTELQTENALEHSYRPALKNLFERLDENITAVNEPVRSAHGSPDFVFFKKTNKNIILGYVETKDIYVNLNDIEKTSQLKRYLGYSNLILTNYIEFRFFRNGEKYQTISIAQKEDGYLHRQEENFLLLERELKAFLEGKPERIKSGKRLAEIMGGKASRIRENVNKYLHTKEDRNKELERVYGAMKELLVHDLTVENFSDMYSQTLVYGLFVARYHDKSPDTFSRQEARDLVPPSNPFLQHFFDHIIGPNFDKRLGYIVDELCEVFAVADIRDIIQRHFNLFGEVADKDPIIHFYEDFLKEYDPALRKSMGAYYTPVPVVKFMIRVVDDILKREFGLTQGIADTTKIQRDVLVQGKKHKETLHKVQILDPAVGTATFLNEIIKYIYEGFKGQEGIWKSYVEQELLPRIYGFELMMAPYTIAHLKLAMTLKETGIDNFDRRIGVYLTNSLEEGIKHKDDLFSFGLTEAISEESKAANVIKHEKPIMVVIGNPPYSVSSNNKSEFIEKLVADYKKDLDERNIQPLSDDYIKFIRFAEAMISKNGSGVVAMITNNSFIDGLIHRQMRKHLLQTFDKIYILNLHGNSKKKETAPDGSKDENVFNIQQGVSIFVAIKRSSDKNKNLGKVLFSEIYGSRKDKFAKLKYDFQYSQVIDSQPNHFFVPINFTLKDRYEKYVSIKDIFSQYGSGIKFRKDKLLITHNYTLDDAKRMVNDIVSLPKEELLTKYHIKETSDWTVESQKYNFQDSEDDDYIKVQYRPFDYRWAYYPMDKINKIIPRGDSRHNLMQNFINKGNIGLLTCRQQSTYDFQHVMLTEFPIDMCTVSLQTKETSYVFPLYLYHADGSKTSNINPNVLNKVVKTIGETSAEEMLQYIYALLHSPKYRYEYKEFLKIDFPRVPLPTDNKKYTLLVSLGKKLQQLHLMENIPNESLNVTFDIKGESKIEKIIHDKNKVWVNEAQCFAHVSKEAWEFFVGGYQPAQKWLKDRKGCALSYEDVTHYRKIIYVLEQTIEIMKQIDMHIIL
jgi:type I restriction-modification system DNA methylase subunit